METVKRGQHTMNTVQTSLPIKIYEQLVDESNALGLSLGNYLKIIIPRGLANSHENIIEI